MKDMKDMKGKGNFIEMRSPDYVVVERFRKSRAAYAMCYDVGDVICFRGRISPNGCGKVCQSCFSVFKVLPAGSEQPVADGISQNDLAKSFVITARACSWPKYESCPVFRIAEREQAKAILVGVPLEDICPED